MKFRSAAASAALLCAFAGSAGAATFAIGNGTDFALPGAFDPGVGGGLINDGSVVQAFSAPGGPFATFNAGNALQIIDAPTTLQFTLLSSEAGFFNITTSQGASILNGNMADGASALVDSQLLDGPLQFSFGTNGGSGAVDLFANNGAGTIDGSLAIAFFQIDPRTVIALFDDSGAGPDSDFDDLVVRISAVPVPAPLALLLAGLGGFVFASRRRSRAA